MIDPAARARLERWKLSLLDLSTASRLLDLDRSPGSPASPGGSVPLTIPLPDLDAPAVAAALADGAAFALASGPAVDVDPRDAGRLRSPLARAELSQRLIAIRRTARRLADRGVHALWLGLGILVWRDGETGPMRRSPLALWPVDLVRAPGGFHLTLAPGLDPVANRLLGDRLRALATARPDGGELDLAARSRLGERLRAPGAAFPEGGQLDATAHGTLDERLRALATAPPAGKELDPAARQRLGEPLGAPGAAFPDGGQLDATAHGTLDERLRALGVGLSDGDELGLGALLAAAEAAAAERPGWRVERGAELGIFDPARVAMWRDLAGRGDDLLASPLVARFCGGGAAEGQPDEWPGGPVELIAPLDADAGQLAAVAATSRGESFVLQGPPGTGKSQTIGNVIANAIAHGKTVLFVADNAAALDVVHQRLAAVGLGDACLALHGQRAVRGEVVGQLTRVLERAFRPVAGPAGGDTRLGELRAALDGHAAAMHRARPFGQSLHAVLGRLIELRSAPCAPLAERDAVGLDRARFDARRAAVEALAATAAAVEPIASHPWGASTLASWPPDGHERVVAALDEAAAAAAELAGAVRDVEQLVPAVVGRTRAQLIALGHLAGLAAGSPRPGAELLTHLRLASGDDIVERIALIRARGTGAIEPPRDPGSFLVLAGRHRALALEVDDRFTDSVAELDAPVAWAMLRRWARRLAPLRYLALRPVRAAIGAAAMPGMLETDGARITALESVIAERAARIALEAAAGPVQRWFGALGGDPLSLDLAAIDAAVRWAAELRLAFDAIDIAPAAGGRRASTDVRAVAWRALVAQVAASPAGDAPAAGELAAFARLADAVRRWQPALAALADATGIADAALGTGDDHLAALRSQIDRLRAAVDGLGAWAAFHDARCAARAAGVGPALGAVERGDLAAVELATAWERATLLAWADAELADTPALARFHGAEHHAHVAAFADLDRAMLALARARALVGVAERVPRVTADPAGELAVLLHEAKHPRGQGTLRRLLAEIAPLWPRLAPCVLASPQAVALHLDPALPAFDLVVFDEASQLPTADAIGALARGRAAVIVGDTCQLPPTRTAVAGDPPDRPASSTGDTAPYGTVDEASLDDSTAELDGLLEDAIAAGLPMRSLTWHYRSRHEDLIALASRRYYGDRLHIVPATHRSPELGIAWRRVDGVYDAAAAHNRVEAAAVASELIARLRDPAQRARSIAVVAPPGQRALIEDLLDAARAEDDELDAACQAAAEPLLVADIDGAQGASRDVALLSIGYGPDASGALGCDLGSLSQRGGEHRLNVAITRAREQLIVFSSLAPEQLPDAAADLAALLAFARDGGGAARGAPDAPPASPVTAAIARALVERGWTLHHQVGCGSYKIDLAVVDPNDPERYVLAIEHDGAAYAGVTAARDRDRLRGELLGQLGWRVHRIWTLDWWTDPEREVQRAHGAIVAAVAASRQRRAPLTARPQPARAAADSARGLGPAAPRVAAESARSARGAADARAAVARPALGGADPARAATAGLGRGGASSSSAASADSARVAAAAKARAVAADGSSPGTRPGAAIRDGGSGGARGPQRLAAGASPVAAAGSGPTDAIAALVGDTASVAAGSAPIKIARNTIPIGPYLAASIPAGRRAPDDLFAPRHVGELGKIIEQVLAAEAPVHLDVLARRVGAYFGIGRLSDRVTEQVRAALAGRGHWGAEADIVWRLDQDPAGVPAVRVAGQGASARREIHEVPLAEVAAAARIVVERATGIAAADLVRDAARLLGFARTTDPVVARVAAGVRLAAQRDLIRLAGGCATLPD